MMPTQVEAGLEVGADKFQYSTRIPVCWILKRATSSKKRRGTGKVREIVPKSERRSR